MAKLRKSTLDLFDKGKSQGFLTQDEILEVFPNAEDRIEELDELYFQLIAEGVDVFESVALEEEDTEEKILSD